MKILVAFLLLICFVTASAAQPRELNITITLIEISHSRDSNGTTTTYTIVGQNVTYEEKYSGYRAGSRPPVHKEYKLTAQEVANLKRLIQEKHLLRSRSSSSSPELSPPYTSYELTEEIRWQGKTSRIKFSGLMKSSDSADMKNDRVYRDADALLEYVRATIDLKSDGR